MGAHMKERLLLLCCLLALVIPANSMKCHTCIGNDDDCTPTEVTCPGDSDKCSTTALFIDSFPCKVRKVFKGCINSTQTNKKLAISPNELTTLSLQQELCDSDLCNTQDIPDPDSNLNDIHCYSCISPGASCNSDRMGQMECQGEEKQCVDMKVIGSFGNIGDVNIKGCGQIPSCKQSLVFSSQTSSLTVQCCNGNFCNSGTDSGTEDKTPNGIQCLSCNTLDGARCSPEEVVKAQCYGDLTSCLEVAGASTKDGRPIPIVIKGCATPSMCDSSILPMLQKLGTATVRCCNGSLCNNQYTESELKASGYLPIGNASPGTGIHNKPSSGTTSGTFRPVKSKSRHYAANKYDMVKFSLHYKNYNVDGFSEFNGPKMSPENSNVKGIKGGSWNSNSNSGYPSPSFNSYNEFSDTSSVYNPTTTQDDPNSFYDCNIFSPHHQTTDVFANSESNTVPSPINYSSGENNLSVLSTGGSKLAGEGASGTTSKSNNNTIPNTPPTVPNFTSYVDNSFTPNSYYDNNLNNPNHNDFSGYESAGFTDTVYTDKDWNDDQSSSPTTAPDISNGYNTIVNSGGVTSANTPNISLSANNNDTSGHSSDTVNIGSFVNVPQNNGNIQNLTPTTAKTHQTGIEQSISGYGTGISNTGIANNNGSGNHTTSSGNDTAGTRDNSSTGISGLFTERENHTVPSSINYSSGENNLSVLSSGGSGLGGEGVSYTPSKSSNDNILNTAPTVPNFTSNADNSIDPNSHSDNNMNNPNQDEFSSYESAGFTDIVYTDIDWNDGQFNSQTAATSSVVSNSYDSVGSSENENRPNIFLAADNNGTINNITSNSDNATDPNTPLPLPDLTSYVDNSIDPNSYSDNNMNNPNHNDFSSYESAGFTDIVYSDIDWNDGQFNSQTATPGSALSNSYDSVGNSGSHNIPNVILAADNNETSGYSVNMGTNINVQVNNGSVQHLTPETSQTHNSGTEKHMSGYGTSNITSNSDNDTDPNTPLPLPGFTSNAGNNTDPNSYSDNNMNNLNHDEFSSYESAGFTDIVYTDIDWNDGQFNSQTATPGSALSNSYDSVGNSGSHNIPNVILAADNNETSGYSVNMGTNINVQVNNGSVQHLTPETSQTHNSGTEKHMSGYGTSNITSNSDNDTDPNTPLPLPGFTSNADNNTDPNSYSDNNMNNLNHDEFSSYESAGFTDIVYTDIEWNDGQFNSQTAATSSVVSNSYDSVGNSENENHPNIFLAADNNGTLNNITSNSDNATDPNTPLPLPDLTSYVDNSIDPNSYSDNNMNNPNHNEFSSYESAGFTDIVYSDIDWNDGQFNSQTATPGSALSNSYDSVDNSGNGNSPNIFAANNGTINNITSNSVNAIDPNAPLPLPNFTSYDQNSIDPNSYYGNNMNNVNDNDFSSYGSPGFGDIVDSIPIVPPTLPNVTSYVNNGIVPNLYYDNNLNNADHYGSNMINADHYGSNMNNANYYGSNMNNADHYGSNMNNADYYGSNMNNADHYGSNMNNADYYDSNINNANHNDFSSYGSPGFVEIVDNIPISLPNMPNFTSNGDNGIVPNSYYDNNMNNVNHNDYSSYESIGYSEIVYTGINGNDGQSSSTTVAPDISNATNSVDNTGGINSAYNPNIILSANNNETRGHSANTVNIPSNVNIPEYNSNVQNFTPTTAKTHHSVTKEHISGYGTDNYNTGIANNNGSGNYIFSSGNNNAESGNNSSAGTSGSSSVGGYNNIPGGNESSTTYTSSGNGTGMTNEWNSSDNSSNMVVPVGYANIPGNNYSSSSYDSSGNGTGMTNEWINGNDSSHNMATPVGYNNIPGNNDSSTSYSDNGTGMSNDWTGNNSSKPNTTVPVGYGNMQENGGSTTYYTSSGNGTGMASGGNYSSSLNMSVPGEYVTIPGNNGSTNYYTNSDRETGMANKGNYSSDPNMSVLEGYTNMPGNNNYSTSYVSSGNGTGITTEWIDSNSSNHNMALPGGGYGSFNSNGSNYFSDSNYNSNSIMDNNGSTNGNVSNFGNSWGSVGSYLNPMPSGANNNGSYSSTPYRPNELIPGGSNHSNESAEVYSSNYNPSMMPNNNNNNNGSFSTYNDIQNFLSKLNDSIIGNGTINVNEWIQNNRFFSNLMPPGMNHNGSSPSGYNINSIYNGSLINYFNSLGNSRNNSFIHNITSIFSGGNSGSFNFSDFISGWNNIIHNPNLMNPYAHPNGSTYSSELIPPNSGSSQSSVQNPPNLIAPASPNSTGSANTNGYFGGAGFNDQPNNTYGMSSGGYNQLPPGGNNTGAFFNNGNNMGHENINSSSYNSNMMGPGVGSGESSYGGASTGGNSNDYNTNPMGHSPNGSVSGNGSNTDVIWSNNYNPDLIIPGRSTNDSTGGGAGNSTGGGNGTMHNSVSSPWTSCTFVFFSAIALLVLN